MVHQFCKQTSYFYPRPLRGGRRPSCIRRDRSAAFLSTPSARRATRASTSAKTRKPISIHALCEEGDPLREAVLLHRHISIHALCEEGDAVSFSPPLHPADFYPRPLRGGRLDRQSIAAQILRISIHALCEEGDTTTLTVLQHQERFLSTPSARRATLPGGRTMDQQEISIHALCEEGDTTSPGANSRKSNFYPRPLRGGRQQKQRQNLYFQTNYTTFCTNLEEP